MKNTHKLNKDWLPALNIKEQLLIKAKLKIKNIKNNMKLGSKGRNT